MPLFNSSSQPKSQPKFWTLRGLAPIAALALLSLSITGEASAQTYSCSQLSNAVRTLDQNNDFRNLNSNTQTASNLSTDLRQLERAFVQAGCQSALNSGQNLNRQCRTAARQITRGHRDMETLSGRINAGQAIANQREQITRQMVLQGCSAGSQATVGTSTRPRNFFEQLFDALSGNNFGSGSIIGDDFGGFGNLDTVRSVCVRKSDGYYWPVSFSTVSNYLQNDALQCQSQCPGVDVDLYYYSNPGQEPKDMVNLSGELYSSLPNAFAYRQAYDTANSCRVQVSFGSIEIVETEAGSRTFINIDERSIALPLRDPRREFETVVIVAEVVHVPLPRPRPRPAGSEPLDQTPVLSAELRVVEVNGRVVRIVGPDTPYAPSGATGS